MTAVISVCDNLIRHGFAVPPSPTGEGYARRKCVLTPTGRRGERTERRLRRMQRGERVAAVEKIEDQCEAPDDFFGHRNRSKLPVSV